MLDAFEPNGRWLTYEQLTNRWGCSQSFIEERIQQTGNSPFEFWPHPLYQDAPLSESMFLLGQVKKVEVRFGLPVCGSRLPLLESGLPFRERGRLGKLPEKATGPVKSKLEEVEQRRIRGPKNPCAIHYWTTLSSWTLEQAAFILLGHEPVPTPDVRGVPFPWTDAHPAVYQLYESLLSAVEDGTLAAKPFTRNDRDGYRVRPIEAYGWLQRNYAEKVCVPPALVEFFAAGPVADPKSEPGKPEQGAAGIQNPAMNRQCITDKASFLNMATWKGTQQATVNHHPKAAYFKGQYDMPTLLRWASEVDPRPKDKRGGRPRKS